MYVLGHTHWFFKNETNESNNRCKKVMTTWKEARLRSTSLLHVS